MPRNPRPDQIGMGGRITPEYAINTVSIQVWCPDITDMGFEELVKVKPDLQCVDCRMVLYQPP
jgi:hypothetical protein